MIDAVKESIRLNNILKDRYAEEENGASPRLDQLYLKVFDTEEGKLVLQDMANRCSVYVPAMNREEFSEGARSIFLMIQTRIRGALRGKKND